MRIALFSDIHSNLEALETAVACARKRGIDRFVILGDTVGYGANPNECFEWTAKNAAVNLLGNHEKAVVDTVLRESFNPMAHEAIVWTEGKMDKTFKSKIPDLPYTCVEPKITFVHGSPNEPEKFHYLMSASDAETSFKELTTPVCFVGHTHVPSCFCEGKHSAERLVPGVLTLEKGERYILNPGSVGQPRDRDPRLAFGLYDEEKSAFEIIRLAYDNVKAANKIRKAGLPRYLADRLVQFG